jgi:hypothetical protein
MKTAPQWPKRPSKLRHPILGRRLRWTDGSKRYRIERFPDDGDPNFIVLVCDGDWRVIAHRRKLKLAKKVCNDHNRQAQQEKTRVRRNRTAVVDR